MKKVFTSICTMLLIVSIVSAKGMIEKPISNKSSKFKNENQELLKKTEKLPCSVSCSMSYNGITYETTAGNWFSSCERASRRCGAKLQQYVEDAEIEF